MYARKKYRRFQIFTVLLILLSSMIYAPIADAKGRGAATNNTAPVITQPVEPAQMTIKENTSGTISLTAKDGNRDSMTWSASKTAVSGSSVSVGAYTTVKGTSTATVTYTPLAGYTGTDSFIVTVSDNKAVNATDSIKITVTIYEGTISYVALGDSIATGTTYPGHVITTYVTHFYEYLLTKYPQSTVTKASFATDGNRTNELYSRLGLDGTSGDIDLINSVTSADVITLSIGGNNLMQAAKDSSALGGYNFNVINTSAADQGLLDFQNQWIPIIEQIKDLNPNAKLIVTTTFNPYNTSDVDLHNTVDSYLSRVGGLGLNDYITININLGYSVADVYKYFDTYYSNNMGAVTYFYPTDFFGSLTRNPHPNEFGQDLITNLVKTAYDNSGY